MDKLIEFTNSPALHETADARASDVAASALAVAPLDVLLIAPGNAVGAVSNVTGVERTLLQRSEAGELNAEATLQEAGMLLAALPIYFDISLHTFAEGESAIRRNWSSELGLAERTLARSITLLRRLRAASSQTTNKNDGGNMSQGDDISEAADAAQDLEDLEAALDASFASNDAATLDEATHALDGEALDELIEALLDAQAVAHALGDGGQVNMRAWTAFGRLLRREIESVPVSSELIRRAADIEARMIHPVLFSIASHAVPDALRQDLLIIFTTISRVLERLRHIERKLRQDEPLKQALPVLLSVRDQLGSLLSMIETRTMRIEDLGGTIFDTLDSTSYAVGMELRRVFGQELLEFSTLRHQPSIYQKAEAAHGLLRDSLQQTLVSIAQAFEPNLDGAQLFDTFRIKREQSLRLREDLWLILQLLLRAERERDERLNAQLEEQLERFRQTSMRYLMFKDWETLERFIEEATYARTASELMPVVHRFGTYVETLFGQVNMRTVLSDIPFEPTTIPS